MIDRTFAQYRVIEKIGAGGMGVVYRARDERLERDVALKVLPSGALADEEMRKRLRKEAMALSRLNHPNIATIYDFNTERDVDFLAMECISGVTLVEKLRSGALPEAEVVRIGKQAAEALEAAHEQGLIHRDLKPGNIMVTAKGLVKLLDFGLARFLRPAGSELTLTLTGTESLSGTLPYMAPEQLQGHNVDERTDIHALGAVLYELATGKKPFSQEAPSEVVQAIVGRKPEPPSSVNPNVSAGLERVILKCLEKNPVDRYASAGELRADLKHIEDGELSSLRAQTPARSAAGRRLWQRPVPVLGILALALAGLAVALNIGGLRGLLIRGPARESGVRSLAVLPLENISQDPKQDYFSEGITDSLITELGQISTVRVISRTSVGRYRKTEKSLPQIAEELKVDMIVEGSVLRAGDRVRITAKLIHPPDERQLWAETYERAIGDSLALQSEIARDITRQIGIRLSEETRLQLANGSRHNQR